jgi:phage gpG-like protein
VRTGALREALTSSSALGARRIMTKDAFDFGTSGIEYASFHQVGTSNMPDRPPFDFGSELERSVTESMKEGVREAMRRTGADEFLSESAL